MNPKLILAMAMFAVTWARGQQLVWQDVGPLGGHSYGAPGGGYVSNLGDLDLDGYDDLLCLGGDVADPYSRALLMTVSGRTGGVLRRRPFGPVEWPLWSMTATGDMDADGNPDYAVTMPQFAATSRVEVCSGTDDRVIWRVSGPGHQLFGMSLLGGVDLNGDGRPDLVLTWPRDGNDGLGTVVAYDHSGALLWKRHGTNTLRFDYEGFKTLSRIGDVDRDGCDDLIVGATDSSGPRTGSAAVLSGRDGRVLTICRDPEGYQIGFVNAAAGDVDGDGVPDIASASGAPVAAVYSGRTGLLIWRWGPWTNHTFDSIAGDVDLDRDGVPDVIAGAPGVQTGPNLNGRIYAFSGRDGSELFHFDNVERPVPNMGQHLAILRRSGEAFPTFVENTPYYQPYIYQQRFGYRGWLRTFRGAAQGAEIYAPACTNTGRTPARIGIRRYDSVPTLRARVHLSNAPSGRQAVLVVGISRTSWLDFGLPAPLDPFGFPGCNLAASADFVSTAMTGTQGQNTGYAFVDLPAVTTVPSIELFAQWIVLDPQPGRLGVVSDALRWLH